LTVNVCPPIVIVPWRACATVLGAAENITVPLPLPLVVPVTVNHDGVLLTAFHEQPGVAVSDVEPIPPPAAAVVLVGESE